MHYTYFAKRWHQLLKCCNSVSKLLLPYLHIYIYICLWMQSLEVFLYVHDKILYIPWKERKKNAAPCVVFCLLFEILLQLQELKMISAPKQQWKRISFWSLWNFEPKKSAQLSKVETFLCFHLCKRWCCVKVKDLKLCKDRFSAASSFIWLSRERKWRWAKIVKNQVWYLNVLLFACMIYINPFKGLNSS